MLIDLFANVKSSYVQGTALKPGEPTASSAIASSYPLERIFNIFLLFPPIVLPI